VHHARFGALLKDTLPISAVDVNAYDAVWVAGGGGPLLTFKDDVALHALIASFHEREKIVALICHGSSLLLWTRLSSGRLLAEGRNWTGFTDEEEEEVNATFGMTLNEYTIQSEAAGIDGTTFLCRAKNEPFAIRDGRLITGQQQYSSALTAELVMEALDEC
jgi:putative intracellular protease/amidase